MKECPKCHTMIEDDAVFCGVCGTKQEMEEVEAQAEEQSSQEEQFCVHCGKSIEVGSAYCPYCGKPQDVEETKNEEPQAKAEVPEQEEPKVKEEPKAKKSPKKEKKAHTTSEKRDKQTDENALEKSIVSMIKAHIKRFQEEEGKTVKSIFKLKSYPKASIQLFSDTDRQSVLKVVINESVEGEKELYDRLKDSKFFKMFVKEDSDTNEESLILDFHNDEEQAKNTILDILTTVYNQPKDCAISYRTNVSGYTRQEKGIENSEKSSGCGCWIWILLALLVGGGVWYFWSNDHVEPQLDSDANKEIEEESKLMEKNREKEEMLAFVKDFYVHYKEDGFIYENVTETTIKQLRRDYPYYCEEDDCLATWVFSAYPAGTDMNLEVGPIIVQVSNGSVFDVSFKYSYMDNGIKKYEERGIRLYVEKVRDRYKISFYDYNDESQASRHDEDKRINRIPEGKYTLWLADMHMFIEVHDSIVEGYYYFKAGTSQTTNIDFAGKADNGLKLHLKQWSVSGKDLGYIDGTFDGKTFKGECDTDKGYRKEFELYVGGE